METTDWKLESRLMSACLIVIGAAIGAMLMSAGVPWLAALGVAVAFLIGAAVAERRLAHVDDLRVARPGTERDVAVDKP